MKPGCTTDYPLPKVYANDQEGEKRYSPAACTGCNKVVVAGNPDLDKASTSQLNGRISRSA
jgi:hypothetical protein